MFTPLNPINGTESCHISRRISTLALSLRPSTQETLSVRRRAPPTASKGFLEADSNKSRLQHPLPHKVCCDLTLLLFPGTDRTSCMGQISLKVAVGASSQSLQIRRLQQRQQRPSQYLAPPSSPFTELQFHSHHLQCLAIGRVGQVRSRDRQACRLPAQ